MDGNDFLALIPEFEPSDTEPYARNVEPLAARTWWDIVFSLASLLLLPAGDTASAREDSWHEWLQIQNDGDCSIATKSLKLEDCLN